MMVPSLVVFLSLMITVAIAGADGMRVAVTGAGGRTGQLLVRKLLQNPAFQNTLALVRTEKSAKKVNNHSHLSLFPSFDSLLILSSFLAL